VAATAADIQRTAALPDSPRLIIQGDKMNPEKWMQSVEGKLVLGSSSVHFLKTLLLYLPFITPSTWSIRREQHLLWSSFKGNKKSLRGVWCSIGDTNTNILAKVL
ncbi:hypothetical protein NFI96_018499, partial [Prochilodus magdalenae]